MRKQLLFLWLVSLIWLSCSSTQQTAPPVQNNINRYPYSIRGSGDVTVVFESGMGDEMWVWGRIFFQTAKIAKVFCYHRPGIAGVPASENPREGKYIVDELRAKLLAAEVKPPYVLVGHSLGGLYMELFARLYPEEVEGLVLVEARPSNMTEQCLKTFGKKECLFDNKLVSYMLPYMRREYEGVSATEQQVQLAPPLADMPVYALIAQDSSRTSIMNDLWLDLQMQRMEKIKQKKITFVPQSHHNLHIKEPEIVIQAIEELIGMVQERRKGNE